MDDQLVALRSDVERVMADSPITQRVLVGLHEALKDKKRLSIQEIAVLEAALRPRSSEFDRVLRALADYRLFQEGWQASMRQRLEDTRARLAAAGSSAATILPPTLSAKDIKAAVAAALGAGTSIIPKKETKAKKDTVVSKSGKAMMKLPPAPVAKPAIPTPSAVVAEDLDAELAELYAKWTKEFPATQPAKVLAPASQGEEETQASEE